MNKWLAKTLVGLGCFVLLSAYALAFQDIDHSIYFPSVVQGHGSCSGAPNPQLIQYNSARINGTNNSVVDFCSINATNERPNTRCDNNLCQVSANTVPSLSLSGSNQFQFSSNTSTQINGCQSGQSLQVTQSNHGRIELYQACTLTFSNQNEYKVTSLTAGGGAVVVLSSGDYWIESLELNQGSQVVVDGDVRLFIRNSSDWNSAQINVSGSGNLTIVGYNNITLNQSNQVKAYLYVGGTLTLHNTSVINGRVTSRRLFMEANTEINQNEQQGYACFTDDFNRSSLGQNWIPYTSSGNFTPSIISNRMRLTEAITNQATAVTYERIFPAAGNLVTVEFDYYAWANLTGNGADGVSVIFSDATVTPKTGGFGGSLGYAQRTDTNPDTPGFAGGWLGVGLDEWGNYSNATEGRQGGPGFRQQAVAIRGSESANYQYLVGTAANLNPKLDVRRACSFCSFPGAGPSHRYFITIDSRSGGAVWVRVDRSVNGTMQTVIDWHNVLSNPNQGATPVDFLLSLAGSTGASVNNHEIENFKVCALKSRPVGQLIDHFRFTLPQQGLTCSASEVQIKACANDNCSQLYTDPVTATLSPNSAPSATGGWVGGSQVNFNNGIATAQLRRNSVGNVSVNVLGSTPASKPFQVNLCSYTNNPNSYSTANCTVNFADSGFIVDVPNAYANQTVTGTIKAVRKDNASQQCLPSFGNVQKSVAFWSDYLEPSSGSSGFKVLPVVVNGTNVGQSANNAQPINLTFDQNGTAAFTVSYREAGNVALNARFTGSGDEQDLLLEGQDSFIRVPKALVLSAKSFYDSDGKCAAADMSCNVFARADENFDLNIRAEAVVADPVDASDDLTIHNYQQQNIALQHTLVQPSTGQSGVLGVNEYTHLLGRTTTVAQKVSEVGVFDFSLVAPTHYLGLDLASANLPIAVTSTGSIGRFIPAYFSVSPMSNVTLDAACKTGNAFSYLGQSFEYSNSPGLYLQPKSANNADTQNYLIDPWWRYNNQWNGRTYSDSANGVNLGFDNLQTSPISRQALNNSGIVLTGERVWYEKPVQLKEVFKAAFDLTLNASNLTDLDGVCYRLDATSPCLGFVFSNIDQTMSLYWGKLVIQDVYGPETQALEQPIYVEHFTNNGFVRTIEDSCTALPAITGFTLQSDPNNNGYTVLTTGVAVPPQVLAEHSAANLNSGQRAIRFSAPGAGARGVIDSVLDLNAHNLLWLAEDKDSDGNFDQTTQGRAQFGLYRGSDRVIWWRESN
ncbi:MSHA biogenesis protein MshQ [Vibrio cholerae]|nr:MSHA biogenesis protein MshQ [Vibrio cholerae]EKG0022895.1 MSHA biogenesis protein MshQ [Vibrio cholerae]EKG0024471.1 MSHA biogenesis protein MshQ [Vibrio cholerae]